MTAAERPDVVIIGGGVIGLSIAWRATRDGLSVTVVDPAPGSGATHAAAGMLAPVTEVHYGEMAQLTLNLESARRWPAFAAELEAETGHDVRYRTDGTLAVAVATDDARALDELVRFQEGLGLAVERLRARECRELEPMLHPRVCGGVLVGADHQVDNRAVAAALLAACKQRGVHLVREEVAALEPRGRVRVGGTGGEVIEAETVVLAAGWRSIQLAAVPVRPVKGQILRLRMDPAAPLVARVLRGLARGSSVYLVPRAGGELVVGATMEERGPDLAVTAGATFELLRSAVELVPGIAELELVETMARMRPGTPDNAPIIGPSPDDRRVVLATGHFRNGILLAPVTADAVVELLVTGRVPALIEPFGVQRFSPAGNAGAASSPTEKVVA